MTKVKSLALVAFLFFSAFLLPPVVDELLGYDAGVGRGAYHAHLVLQMLSGMALLWVVALRRPQTMRFMVTGVVLIGLFSGLADAMLGISTGSFVGTLHVLVPKFMGAFLLVALLRVWGAFRSAPAATAA